MDISSSGKPSLKAMQAVILSDMSCILDQARDYFQAVVLLKEFEQVLMAYFKCQDDVFYRCLFDRFGHESRHSKMIDFLQQDIFGIKVDFLKFMDRYTIYANPVRIRNFPKDFLAFSRRISDRMLLEREYLFLLLSKKK